MTTTTAPNHHRDHPGFSGLRGYVGALTMVAGRGDAARAAIDAVDLAAGDRLVDVGCGPGVAARIAARRGATVIGVDPAPPMLRFARLRRAGDVAWREGSAEQLPVDDEWATVLWSIASVHHWRDVEAGLVEARRVLAPGGRLLAMERRVRQDARGLASHGWTEAQAHAFADLCTAAGFTATRVEDRRGRMLVAATAPS